LPRDVAFGEGVEFEIVRSGDVMTIYPVRTSISEMIELSTRAALDRIERR